MEIRRLTNLPSDITSLAEEAKVEGFQHIERLVIDFESGKNRFEREGEILLAVVENEKTIAVGGINRYEKSARIRRVYVHPEFRRQCIGKALMEVLETHALDAGFKTLHLRTDTERGSRFYESLGYEPITGNPLITHMKALSNLP